MSAAASVINAGPQLVPTLATIAVNFDLEEGWTKVPHQAFEVLWRVLNGGVDVCVLLNIWDKTIGGEKVNGRRPEWAAIEQEKFAYWANCHVSAVRKALRNLEEKKLIMSREFGRRCEYRVLRDNVVELVERPRRESPPPAPEPVLVKQRTTLLFHHGSRHSLELPTAVQKVDLVSTVPQGFDMQTEVNGATLELSFKPSIEKKLLAAKSEDPANLTYPAGSQSNTKGSPVDTRLTEVREFLLPIFNAHQLGLEKPTLGQILEELGPAMGEYKALVPDRLEKLRRKRGFVSPGIFINWAKDAHTLYKQRPPAPAAPPPAPDLPPWEPDPLDADNPWARVRRELQKQKKLSQIQFDNWLKNTRYLRSIHGVIQVQCPDAHTAEFITQEWLTDMRRPLDACGYLDFEIVFVLE